MFNGELRYQYFIPRFILAQVDIHCIWRCFAWFEIIWFAFSQFIHVFTILLWQLHHVSHNHNAFQKKNNRALNYLVFCTFHGSTLAVPGANSGQWFPAFEHPAASISGGLRSFLFGLCIPFAQTFTGWYLALFDRRFSRIYSGHCTAGVLFIFDVEKLHNISTSWHSVSCISRWLRAIPMIYLK